MAEENMVQVGDIEEQPETITSWATTEDFVYDDDCEYIETDDSDVKIFGTNEQRQKMFTSLAEYFGEVENPENTMINTFFKAKYSPLNEVLNTIRPYLSKYGFGIIQPPTTSKDSEFIVTTILTHKDGAYIVSSLKYKPTKADIQGVGSTITYLRRFALNSVTGVSGEVDDDGNSNSKEPKGKTTEEEKKPNEAYDACVAYIAKGTTQEEKKTREKIAIDIIKKYATSGKPEELKSEDRKKVVNDIKKLG
jgi:hypothetical protein